MRLELHDMEQRMSRFVDKTYKDIESNILFEIDKMGSGYVVHLPERRDHEGWTRSDQHAFSTFQEAREFINVVIDSHFGYNQEVKSNG
jgi:hypothetical protein